MNLKTKIVEQVRASAKEKLPRAIERKDLVTTSQILKEIVESILPDSTMPDRTLDRIPGIGGVVQGWRWVGPTGTITLVANVPPDFEALRILVVQAYPGMRSRPTVLFNQQASIETIEEVVAAAVQYVQNLGFLRRS